MTIGEKMNSCIRNSEKYQLIVTEAYSNPIEKEASSVVVKIFNKYNLGFSFGFCNRSCNVYIRRLWFLKIPVPIKEILVLLCNPPHCYSSSDFVYISVSAFPIFQVLWSNIQS